MGDGARRLALIGNVGGEESIVDDGDKLVVPLTGAGSGSAEAASKEVIAVGIKLCFTFGAVEVSHRVGEDGL